MSHPLDPLSIEELAATVAAVLDSGKVGPDTRFWGVTLDAELGALSQNQLGRLTRMDPATISGVVGRLIGRGYVRQAADLKDARLVMLTLTPNGQTAVKAMKGAAAEVSRRTLEPLEPREKAALLEALAKIA